jgi:hypothetical protein
MSKIEISFAGFPFFDKEFDDVVIKKNAAPND